MKSRYNKVLLATASILLLGASACTVEPAPGPLETAPAAQMDGGGGAGNTGDDDEPVIQGNVTNSSQSTIANASVSLLDAQGTFVLDSTLSDAQGQFTFLPDSGTYRILVTAPGYTQVVTDTMLVETTVSPEIVLQ